MEYRCASLGCWSNTQPVCAAITANATWGSTWLSQETQRPSQHHSTKADESWPATASHKQPTGCCSKSTLRGCGKLRELGLQRLKEGERERGQRICVFCIWKIWLNIFPKLTFHYIAIPHLIVAAPTHITVWPTYEHMFLYSTCVLPLHTQCILCFSSYLDLKLAQKVNCILIFL